MDVKNYIYVPKSDINEGFTTGTITKAALFFTKQYLFILPFKSIGQLGMETTKVNYDNMEDYIDDLNNRISSLEISDFENELKENLPEDRVFAISDLDKFSVKTGFFGGMSIKKTGE